MRLFVAVDVSEETRVELNRLRDLIQRRLGQGRVPPRITWVKTDAAHVTLRFIGEVPDDIGASLAAALGPALEVPPFEVVWSALGTFPLGRSPKVIWLGATRGTEELEGLATLVGARVEPVLGALERSERHGSEARAFTAHVTLARVKEPGKGVDWTSALASARPRRSTTLVDCVTLYRSHLSSKGPTYTAMATARLKTTGD